MVIVALVLSSLPLALSVWALLDAARRPSWAWAMAGRSQLIWLAAIAFGLFTVFGGVLIAGWYLIRVRRDIASIEAGDFGAFAVDDI